MLEPFILVREGTVRDRGMERDWSQSEMGSQRDGGTFRDGEAQRNVGEWRDMGRHSQRQNVERAQGDLFLVEFCRDNRDGDKWLQYCDSCKELPALAKPFTSQLHSLHTCKLLQPCLESLVLSLTFFMHIQGM